MLVRPHGRHQSALNFEPRIVGMMKNAEVAVSAFAVQVVLPIFVLVKLHTPLHKRFDGIGRIAHNVFHGGQVRNVVASHYRVVDVLFKIVYVKVGYCGHSALRFGRVSFVQSCFAHKGNLPLSAFCHTQCVTHACYTAADNKEVELLYHKCFILILIK